MINRYVVKIVALLLLIAGFTVGCAKSTQPGPQFAPHPDTKSRKVLHLAVHPLHNPTKLITDYQPLMDRFNQQLRNTTIMVEASRDYATFEQKLRARQPELILPNPWQTIQAIPKGYHVIAMAGDPKDFTGVFIVRRDSPIKTFMDLKGKVVSYPSATALAACIMPQYFLHTHGVSVNRDITNRYVGSQESAIMNAYLRVSDVAATWPNPWRAFQIDHPEQAAQLRLIWETEHLVNNSVMVRDDMPAQLRDQFRNYLLQLDKTPEGIVLLKGIQTNRFYPATDQDYQGVREFIQHFEQEVRRVDQP